MTTYANRSNLELIDSYYKTWKKKPTSVDGSWQSFFEGFEFAANGAQPELISRPSVQDATQQSQVDSLIYAYRALGHTLADINPLSASIEPQTRLDLKEYGLTEANLDEAFDSGHYLDGGPMTLRDILVGLQATYCGKMGIEYIHMQDIEARRWIQGRLEPIHAEPNYSKEKKIRISKKPQLETLI